MKALSSSRCLAGAAVLALLVNAVVLGNTLYNRSGDADSQLRLSQRELSNRWSYFDNQENSGLSLKLQWTRLNEDATRYSDTPFSAEQLRAAGIDTDTPETQPKRLPERDTLVVLELDGPAHQATLQDLQRRREKAAAKLAATPDDARLKSALEEAERMLRNSRDLYSRLYAVDIGLDRDALRQRYPDRRQYAIVHGVLSSWITNEKREWHLSRITPGEVSVPYQWRDALSGRVKNDDAPYEVEITFGQRLEPWISDAFLP